MIDSLTTVFTSQGYMETPFDSMGLLYLNDKEVVSEDPLKAWYILHRWNIHDRTTFISEVNKVAGLLHDEFKRIFDYDLPGETLYQKLVEQGYFKEETDWNPEKAITKLYKNGKYIPVFETETYKILGKYSMLLTSTINKVCIYRYYLFPILLPNKEKRILKCIKENYFKRKMKTSIKDLLLVFPAEHELIRIIDSLYRKRCIYIFNI
jgi:hypothetical protein